MISPGFVFDLGLLSADRWGRIFPKWPPLEEHMPVSTPETFASSVLPSSDPQSLPVFPGDPPRTAVRPPQIPMESLLCLGPCGYESLCVPFKNGVSVSPSPMEL